MESTVYFESLSEQEQTYLSEKKKPITYLKGETIFKQEAFAQHVIYINQGVVKVSLQTEIGKQINLWIATAGSFLGFSSLFGENSYMYTAVALDDSVVCMIDKDHLRQVLIRNPEFAMNVTSKSYQQERRYLNLLNNLAFKQMRGKLASTILYLSQIQIISENIFQLLTRQDLADFANISQESTIKFLKEFEKDNIITLEGRNIIVKNQKKLTDIEHLG